MERTFKDFKTSNSSFADRCGDNEKIKYIGVCSLYPWVCKYGKFPVGHPQVCVYKCQKGKTKKGKKKIVFV